MLPNTDFNRKIKDFIIFTKIVGDLGKLIVATRFENLPKAQSGHTDLIPPSLSCLMVTVVVM